MTHIVLAFINLENLAKINLQIWMALKSIRLGTRDLSLIDIWSVLTWFKILNSLKAKGKLLNRSKTSDRNTVLQTETPCDVGSVLRITGAIGARWEAIATASQAIAKSYRCITFGDPYILKIYKAWSSCEISPPNLSGSKVYNALKFIMLYNSKLQDGQVLAPTRVEVGPF